MERETRKFQTSGGHEVEMKTYLTFGESKAISDVYLEGVKVKLGADGKPELPTFEAQSNSRAQDKAIEILLVSLDGSVENVYQRVMDLPQKDGEEVIAAIEKLRGGLGDEKKAQ